MSEKKMDNAKRNLIKASVAVPMVFTVRAASAQALGSVWVCATRDANRARTASPAVPKLLDTTSIPTSDEWLRVQKDLSNLKKVANDKLVKSSVDSTKDAIFFQPGDGNYWEVVLTNGVYSIPASAIKISELDSRYSKVLLRKGNFLAYQTNGALTKNFGFDTSSGTAITCSCWTSLPRVV